MFSIIVFTYNNLISNFMWLTFSVILVDNMILDKLSLIAWDASAVLNFLIEFVLTLDEHPLKLAFQRRTVWNFSEFILGVEWCITGPVGGARTSFELFFFHQEHFTDLGNSCVHALWNDIFDFFLRKPSFDAREVDFSNWCFVAAWAGSGLLL